MAGLTYFLNNDDDPYITLKNSVIVNSMRFFHFHLQLFLEMGVVLVFVHDSSKGEGLGRVPMYNFFM